MPVAEMLAKRPKAIILSGGPASVYEPGAPPVDPTASSRPACRRSASATASRPWRSRSAARSRRLRASPSTARTDADRARRRRALLAGLPGKPVRSGCRTATPARRRRPGSSSPRAPTAPRSPPSRTPPAASTACSSTRRSCTPSTGRPCCGSFLTRRRLPAVLDDGQHRGGVRRGGSAPQVGGKRAICGLSGGVDSAVAAALVQRAIGDRLTCVFVDHGLLRKGEAEQVEQDFVAATGRRPQGGRRRRAVPDRPRRRHRPRGEAQDHRPGVHPGLRAGRPRVLDRATASPWSSSCRARSTPTWSSPAAARAPPTSSPTTTSAACPTTFSSPWSSRCGRCSRTRYAGSARSSACPSEIVWRQPFPGPGLGIRIVGAVTRDRLDLLREADAIAREELSRRRPRPRHLAVPGRAARRRTLGRRAGRRPHVRPSDRAPPGDQRGRHDRRLGAAPVRRARSGSPPASPTRSARSTASCVDITSKPPGTIEWE